MNYSRLISKILWISAIAFLTTCKSRNESELQTKLVVSAEASFYNAGNRNIAWQDKDQYLGSIQPLLAKRCAVCHTCSDSPCSLKLNSYEGFQRGASKSNPYKVRVGELDFPSEKQGAKDFFAVHSPKFNDSLMFQFLKLGANNTTEEGQAFRLDANTSLDANHGKATFTCPQNLKEFQAYASSFPNGGMPYGLPKIEQSEHERLLRWLAENAGKGPKAEVMDELYRPTQQEVIHAWEMFLNFGREGLRSQLVARYIFEHTFNAHIVFDEMPGEFFRLVRTNIAPPQGNPKEFRRVVKIETSLPTDAVPGSKPFYYRFEKLVETIAQKDNVVFRLSKPAIEHYQKLFFDPKTSWSVTKLPGYDTADVFKNFAAIPGAIRHRFMLENARYIADSMVRAPVCKGESATFAIADHFWVFFLKPESDPSSGAKIPMNQDGFDGLNMDVTAWTNSGAIEDRFVRNYNFQIEYETAMRKNLGNRKGLGLKDLWFGEPLVDGASKANRNSWLSITRHDTNTTVQFGHEGGMPQSMWVLSYANFERLYYNLVVNFKYWGSIDHKLGTWRNMSHERMDGEDIFLSFLPPNARNQVRDEWSGGLELSDDQAYLGPIISKLIKLKTGIDTGGKPVRRYLDLYPLQSLRQGSIRDTEVAYNGDLRADYQLARLIRDNMKRSGVIAQSDELNSDESDENILPQDKLKSSAASIPSLSKFDDWDKAVKQVFSDRGRGRYAPYLPAITWVRVKTDDGNYRIYSLIGNRGYKSHNISLLSSSETSSPVRDIARDTTSIYRGIVGDYPQLFLDTELNDGNLSAAKLLQIVQSINNSNYRQKFDEIRRSFAIERNSPKFWPFVDWLHDWMIQTMTDFGPGMVWAGLIDLSKYGYYKN
jgi:hypothetical protein